MRPIYASRCPSPQMGSGHLLWVRDASLPDVGATDECPADILEALAAMAADRTGAGAAPASAPRPSLTGGAATVSRPGAYRGVCVELGVFHLALCALLKSDAIEAAEGRGPGTDACGAALAQLRRVVLTWQAK